LSAASTHIASCAVASTKQAGCAAAGASLQLVESGPFASAVSVAAAAVADTSTAAANKQSHNPYVDVQSVVYGRVVHSPYAMKSLVCGEVAMRSMYVDVRSVAGTQDAAGCCHYVI
jgi:hypothetical protein